MRKIAIFFVGMFCLINLGFAAPECDSTWSNSSAAQSCGYVCTNPENTYSYPSSSTYDAKTDQCTFKSGCCQGLPYQICSYQWAVCDPATITVKRGDSGFQNVYGKLKHN